MVLELKECNSFEEHINIKTWTEETDTHIGTKTEECYSVKGFVSISLAEFKQAWFEATEEAMDWQSLEAKLEIDYKYYFENESFEISDKYEIRKDRVTWKLEE
jgi:hypothetical protein